MTSLDLSKQDQSTIDALKLELENSWATIDELHENELASKREASELRLEIERLTRDDDRRTDGAPRAEPIPKTPLRFNARARAVWTLARWRSY